MKDVIIELSQKIKNSDHCTNCGGNYNNGICNFCGKENQQLSYLILQLEKEISKLPENSFEQDELDECLTSLYIIRNMQIPIVTKILNEYNYETKIIKTCTATFDSGEFIFQNNMSLSPSVNNLLFQLFLNNEFTKDNEMFIANYLIKLNLMESAKFNLSSSDKEKLILKVTELIGTSIVGFSKVNTRIQDNCFEDKENTLGMQAFNYIYLSRKAINANPKSVFPTMFHELIHLKQQKEHSIDYILSGKNLIQIKDNVLSQTSTEYYALNYQNISFEKGAFFYQYRETIDYFNAIGVEVPEEFYEKATLCTNLYGDFAENKVRIKDNGKTCDIDEFFNETIISHPEELKKYPQLCFEYKVIDNQVLPKTLEEIQQDYQEYKNGNLKWNGNPEEIDDLYLKKLNELDNNKSINKCCSFAIIVL